MRYRAITPSRKIPLLWLIQQDVDIDTTEDFLYPALCQIRLQKKPPITKSTTRRIIASI